MVAISLVTTRMNVSHGIRLLGVRASFTHDTYSPLSRINWKSMGRSSCRQIHDSPNGASTSTFRQRLGELRYNGSPEIVFGVIILSLAGIDYMLRVQDDKPRKEMYRQLELEVQRDEMTSRNEEKRMIAEDMVNTSLKFKCIVRRVPEQFDGHKCLQNIKVGDVVGVLEEGIGPGGQYNLCSIERNAADKESKFSIGWFPCSCLEKLK
jgi:hypothetical protein